MIFSECYRLYYIIRVILNYGLVEFIPENKFFFPIRLFVRVIFQILNKHPQLILEERLRLALQELGPIWIKFGQMLSTRRDICSDSIVDQLKILQDRVEPFDGLLAKQHIERAIGHSLDVYFYDFEQNPLASASISQVHTARLRKNNKEVIIKVIRPNILSVIQLDIQLMYRLIVILPKFLLGRRKLQFIEIISEYKKTLMCELDLLRESVNTIQLRRNFHESAILYIPKVYTDYCSKEVLVMERVYGIPVSDLHSLEKQGVNMKLLAERGVDIFLTQVFRDSFFHADMHPGNVFVSYEHPDDPQYIGIDCGLVGSLNKKDKYYLAENFIAFLNRDYRKIAELHLDSGWIPLNTNIEDFEFAIRMVFEPIFEKPLEDISCSQVLLSLFSTARRFNMDAQPQLMLLQKALFYVEGMVRYLYPKLDFWKTVRPFIEKWVKDQISCLMVFRCLREKSPVYFSKLPELVDLTYDVCKQGRFLNQTIHNLILHINLNRVKQGHARFLFGIGAIFVFIGILLFIKDESMMLFSFFLVLIGIITWIIGWNQTI
ncbi:ubiquinone biosynthesis regulatory protein kinase UbiB [Blochmannia endosymbiont of Polyrhachis (Hedomyrma) turneri]|uniref:ubiquinone biosynthesis regulatory protein kinase UbiB n=1 Tax=Blochmannia endosymbiont of Polyrhachis (Hedomyrma) turneri TaxID=1505596 RepID=UPI00061A7950|nr:ubiquinone biosynthesis regulatory protein kinase UbiB [Blochmannia endosymbiont of Polyrhachis (Hedomyrma) turneri]AKC60176.1 putative ubiquinone biosynthesis protein UbiB [Blochmannia endosymbiont of Polyrhachis (Hedomyrma) turneri]